MNVRIVGAVAGRIEALAYVTDPSGAEVRVRWRGKDKRGGAANYRCDEHGKVTKRGCPHAAAAHRAFRDARKREAEVAT